MENKQDLITELERIHKLQISMYNEKEKLSSIDKKFENKLKSCTKKYYTELGKLKKEYEGSNSVKIPEMFSLSPTAKNLVKRLPMDILHWPEKESASSYMWYYVIGTKYKKEIYTGIIAYACGILALLSLAAALLFNIKILILACIFALTWYCLKHIVSPESAEEYWIHHEKVKEFENLFNECVKNEDKERFYKEFQEYDKYFDDLKKYCDEQLLEIKPLYLKERENIESEHREQRKACEESVNKTAKALAEVTIINEEMFERSDKIADALKIGRADTLKEAINIVLDEERKDSEENTRRAEAYLLAAQNQLHNKAMQEIAEAEAEETRAYHKVMAENAKEQFEFERKQRVKDLDAARSRCFSCVNYSKCPRKIRENPINCNGFRPK